MASRHRLHSASDWSELGERIKAVRLKAGMTQVELGAVFSRRHTFVGKIESGERQLTALELRDLCDALGITPNDLLGRG